MLVAIASVLAVPEASAPAVRVRLCVLDVFAALENKIIDISLLRGVLPPLLLLGDRDGDVFMQPIEFLQGGSVHKINGKAPPLAPAGLGEVLAVAILEALAAVVGPGLRVLRCGREDLRGEVDSIELKGFKHINDNKPLPR